jgi:hypothetical protein
MRHIRPRAAGVAGLAFASVVLAAAPAQPSSEGPSLDAVWPPRVATRG